MKFRDIWRPNLLPFQDMETTNKVKATSKVKDQNQSKRLSLYSKQSVPRSIPKIGLKTSPSASRVCMPRKTSQPRYRRPSSTRWETPRRPLSKSVTRPINVLKRCSSAPGSLPRIGTGVEGHNDEDSTMGGVARSFAFKHGPLFRGHTCTDVHLSHSSSCSPEGYRKDAKVVVNVTVEGSPGPIRTMVRLGCSVEDTILAVVDRYGQEGRTPKLDRDSVTGYELHHSYFSLQSLEKSECIGGVGCRSFYLRTSSNNNSASLRSNPPPPVTPPLFMVSTVIAHMLGKITRRARKLWKVVICSRYREPNETDEVGFKELLPLHKQPPPLPSIPSFSIVVV